MSRIHLLLFLIAPGILVQAGSPEQAHAQRDAFGIGLMIGDPAGLSVKRWLSNTRALDAGAAWSVINDPGAQFHVDMLYHRSDLEGLRENRSYAYYGIGGRVRWSRDVARLGIRIPLGVTYLFPGAPLDAFFEVVPVFDVVPDTRLILNLSIGMRYYFSAL